MPKPVPARQTRSRATVEKVLNAAEELFAERGEAGFTLPEVARRAGVSVGSIYRRFSSREDLLIAVFDRLRSHEEEAALSAWATTDWAVMTPRAMMDCLVWDVSQLLRDREQLMRAIMARRLTVGDDQVFEHGLQDVIRDAALFEEAVIASGHRVKNADPHAAVEFAYRLIVSTSHRWAAREIEVMAPTPMSWEQMLEHLTEAVTRYLFD